ncbi:hypothetical protein EV697_101493 [Bisgaardia hudsonensis]|uniref:Uncharacterized protein n=1 Tax=Bisgaardia hudsonensis TaxID=109472 RepID=A0A4R2N3F7_9PAST|nr:hypothetical protein [Bisgaardia hudsonensis]QLB12796.1 hypothetical protein A6A11_03840 [Bisgaardia hudsonensis]TCP14352.1 hypothetical protein EV697_101493 [Bisgaardia hudsonensis]
MNVLTAYFNTQLVQAGFPDDFEINWSLGYSQGDGMAFYGDIEHTYWLGLFQRIYPNQKRKCRKFERLVRSLIEWQSYGDSLISINRNHHGYHYSHFNTMSLDAPSADDFCFFNDERAKKEWYFPTYKVGEYQALWDEFVVDLTEYIQDLSKQLAQEGYRIIEATPYQKEVAYQFETQHYRVEFVTEPHEFYAHHFETYMYDCDFEDVESLCKSVLNGTRIANVYAQVLDKETGIALGEDYFGYLCYDQHDKTFGGYRQILIREAIKAACSKDGLISRQAQLMQKKLSYLHTPTN